MVVFLIFVICVPMLIGLSWDNVEYETLTENLIYRYVMGFVSVFALFELVSVPMCFFRMKFSSLTDVFTVIVLICSTVSAALFIKKFKFKKLNSARISISLWGKIYCMIFVVLLCIQVLGMIFIDIGARDLDDSTYVAQANSAIFDNSMYLTSDMTGLGEILDIRRSLQGSILLFAYLAKISGLSTASVFHTYMAVALIIIAYGIYFLMAKGLFKSYENVWIFLIFIELLYIFGHFSEYSMTFRLLGPIWQGKAILEVLLTPFLFALLPKIFTESFSVKNVLFLIVLSVAAISMTMGGAILMVALMCVLGPMFYIIKRDKAIFFYIFAGCIFPCIAAGFYLIMR